MIEDQQTAPIDNATSTPPMSTATNLLVVKDESFYCEDVFFLVYHYDNGSPDGLLKQSFLRLRTYSSKSPASSSKALNGFETSWRYRNHPASPRKAASIRLQFAWTGIMPPTSVACSRC
jgi:hypothetical protein